MRSTLPLFPSDDGWPYPDSPHREPAADAPDLDALELLGPHAYDSLTTQEHDAVRLRFGLHGTNALSMKELAPALGCSRPEAGVVLGRAIHKMRLHLRQE